MNITKFCSIAVIFATVSFSGALAQEAVTASGGVASGDEGTVSYSVGQVASISASGATGSVSQGVQQPYEIFIQTGISALDINPEVLVYPNPATDLLYLEMKNYKAGKNSWKLFDNQGKLLKNKKISSNSTSIDLSGLKPGVYILNISGNREVVISYKIIKN